MPEPEHNHFDRMTDRVGRKERRKIEARRAGDRSVWFGLGMFGMIGWSVAIPTLIGVAIGYWIDHEYADAGGVSWTLSGLVVGLAIGCLVAWRWVQREQHRE